MNNRDIGWKRKYLLSMIVSYFACGLAFVSLAFTLKEPYWSFCIAIGGAILFGLLAILAPIFIYCCPQAISDKTASLLSSFYFGHLPVLIGFVLILVRMVTLLSDTDRLIGIIVITILLAYFVFVLYLSLCRNNRRI